MHNVFNHSRYCDILQWLKVGNFLFLQWHDKCDIIFFIFFIYFIFEIQTIQRFANFSRRTRLLSLDVVIGFKRLNSNLRPMPCTDDRYRVIGRVSCLNLHPKTLLRMFSETFVLYCFVFPKKDIFGTFEWTIFNVSEFRLITFFDCVCTVWTFNKNIVWTY